MKLNLTLTSHIADDYGNDKIYTTRFSAITALASIKANGHEAQLVPTGTFYKILVTGIAPNP